MRAFMALLRENLFVDGLDHHAVEGLDRLAPESSESLLSELSKVPDFIKGTVLIIFLITGSSRSP